MLIKVLLTLLIGLLAFSFQVTAQEDVNPQISNLYVFWHKPDKQVAIDLTAYDLRHQLEQNLTSEGITIQWIENGERTNSQLVDIQIDLDEDVLYFTPVGNRRLSVSKLISPILFDVPESISIPLELPFDLDQDKDFLELFTAMSLYSIDRCDLAMPHFKASLQNTNNENNAFDSSDLWIWQSLFYDANCDILAHDYPGATKSLEPIASTWDIPSTVNLAWAYLQIGEHEKCFAIMTDLLNGVVPLNYVPAILSKRAQLYALVGQYDNAIADLTTGIEKSFTSTPDLHLLRGKMYLAQYEWDSALADYNKAIELDPTYADAYYERGVLYYSILQTGVELRTEAFDDFHRYLELAPDGDHAADAARYTAQIEKELAALNG